MNEFLFDIYRFNATTSFPNDVLSHAELVSRGYVRQYFNPHYVSEHRMPVKQGVDWYVISDHRDASQGPWIDSLRSKPLLSQIINRIWPRETLALEFYQTSTQQKLNRMAVHPNSKYCISPDGKWIAGMLRYQFELNLYSTAPVIRWPGYLFVVAMLIVLVWCRRVALL